MMMVASSAALGPTGEAQICVPRKTATVAKPASSEAAPYRQTAAIKNEPPNPIGRPAYQKAGIRRMR
jgi:hypothetical protein